MYHYHVKAYNLTEEGKYFCLMTIFAPNAFCAREQAVARLLANGENLNNWILSEPQKIS